ncbi:MAG TPA: ankyrin repeat domain-containing protein [Pyrinomonadaceae bacterium]|jgi:ankyrin repeat protein
MSKEQKDEQGERPEQASGQKEVADAGRDGASFYTPFSPLQVNAPAGKYERAAGPEHQQPEEGLDDYERYASKAAAIWQALRKNDSGSLQRLLDEGVDVNESDSEDSTLLHHAVSEGQTEIVRLLLERGADVNVPNLYGHTPLMVAAERGRCEVAQLLLTGGADPNMEVQLDDGRTPSSPITAMKLARDHAHTDIVELLKQAGARQ